jgi:hypothetical protein
MASPAISGRPASLRITHERNAGRNGGPLGHTVVHDPEDGVSEGPMEYHAKFSAPHSSSEGEASLELERQLSVSLAAGTERDRRIAQLTEELALKSSLLEQAEANAVEAAGRAGSELRGYMNDQRLKWRSLVNQREVELVDMQAKLDELLLSRDKYEKELGNLRAKLAAKESELLAVCLRLADAEKDRTSLDELVASRDQQFGQYEKELKIVRAKLEAKESELEAVLIRLMDAEKGWTKSKGEADTLPAKNATGSMIRDEDQVTRRLMERMRALEAKVASKRWDDKSIEDLECSNEKSTEEMESRNEG